MFCHQLAIKPHYKKILSKALPFLTAKTIKLHFMAPCLSLFSLLTIRKISSLTVLLLLLLLTAIISNIINGPEYFSLRHIQLFSFIIIFQYFNSHYKRNDFIFFCYIIVSLSLITGLYDIYTGRFLEASKYVFNFDVRSC